MEVVGQFGRRRISLVRVARHRLQHDGLQVARDRGIELPRPGRFVVQDPVQQRGAVRLVERRPAADQLIERDAQPVNIGPRIPAPLIRSGAA